MNFHKNWSQSLMRWARTLCLMAVVSTLTACALTPQKEDGKRQSDALLQHQLQHIESQWLQTTADERRHVFLGSAQHSQSLVFQRDILSMEKNLKNLQPKTVSILLSNQVQTQKLEFPFATTTNLTRIFDRLATWSHAQPMSLTVLVSTHGSPGMLSVNIGNQYHPPLRTAQLKTWLDHLHPRTQVTLLLSACYSSSFVDALQGLNRMILSASAADRNSFGCTYHEKNTWFIGQLLGPHFAPQSTWDEVFTATRAGVEAQERALRMSPPSNPQIRSAESLRKISLAQWFGKPANAP